jgi:preprotein translocase subunit SecF
MLDIVGKRYWFFGLSLLVIIPGLIFLIAFGLPLAIDFSGGSLLEIAFVSGNAPALEDVRTIYTAAGFPDSVVQSSGSNSIIIRSKAMDDTQKAAIVNTMSEKFNSEINILRFESVGASIGKEVTRQALYAVGAAALAITLYITFAFRGVPNAWRYGISAVIAMVHDILVVIGLEAMLGQILGWETDALFLTALLTVIGFSVHDTIVVFDRIRENTNIFKRIPYEQVVNHSIVQTLVRSINTSTTVMITLLSLALLGGVTTRHFTIILLIGIFSGTYSSIFNAASILVVWENKEWKTWFRRRKETPAAV